MVTVLMFGHRLALCLFLALILFIRTYNKLKKYEKNFIKEIQELNKEEKKVLQTRSKIFTQVLKSQKII